LNIELQIGKKEILLPQSIPRKKKPKRRKNKKEEPLPEQHIEETVTQHTEETSDSDFRCKVCHQTFITRNQLYKHIKQFRHAIVN